MPSLMCTRNMAELNNNMQYEEFYLNHLSANQQIMYAEYKDLYDRQDGYLKRLYMELSISLHRMDDILYLEALKLIYIM